MLNGMVVKHLKKVKVITRNQMGGYGAYVHMTNGRVNRVTRKGYWESESDIKKLKVKSVE